MFGFLFAAALASVSIRVEGQALVIDGMGRIKESEFEDGFAKVDPNAQFDTLIVTGSIYSIDGNAFKEKSSIPEMYAMLYSIISVDLGSVETLEDNLFHSSFTKITKVTFGSKIRYIGENFEGCPELSIDIPATVERVNPKLLHWIKSFNLDKNNKLYSVCDDNDKQYLLYANRSLIFGIADTKSNIDLKIPDCITELDTLNQFSMDIKFNSIDLNQVKVIHKNAFANCQLVNQFELTLQPVVEKIEAGAFPTDTQILIGQNKNFELIQLGGFEFLTKINDKNIIHLNPNSYASGEEHDLEITNEYTLYPRIFNSGAIKFKTLKIDCLEIPQYAFSDSIIQYLAIGASVRKVAEHAFDSSKIYGGEKIPKTIVELGEYAFYKAFFKTETEDKAWCVVEIGTTNVPIYAFSECNGLKSVIICAKNVTLNMGAFYYDSDIESVTNDGGYIGYIYADAFSNCHFKKLDLTEDIAYVYPNSVPIESLNEYGMLIVGSKLVTANSDVEFSETEISLKDVKYILSRALQNYDKPDVSITFDNVEEIGDGSISVASFNKLTFGKKLTKMDGSTDFKAESVTFQSDTITFSSKSGISFEGVKQLKLPENVIYYYKNLNFKFSSSIEQTISFNGSKYEVKNDNSVTLSSDSYTENVVNFEGENIKLVIKGSVKTIKYKVLSNTNFASVSIEEGIKSLFIGFKSESTITIPASVMEMSYNGETALELTNSQFIVEKNFIVSKDKKRLCGFQAGADIKDLPAVEVIGAYSLYKYDTEGSDDLLDLTLPKGVKRIEEGSLPGNIRIKFSDNVIEVIDEQLNGNIEFATLPSSLTKVSASVIAFYTGEIEKGTKAFELVDNVWYMEGNIEEGLLVRVALALDNKNVDKVNFDSDLSAMKIIGEIGMLKDSLKEVSFSDRIMKGYDGWMFDGFSKLEKITCNNFNTVDISGTPIKHSLNLTGSYVTIGNESVYQAIRVGADKIPAGVLDIYINSPVSYFGKQKHSPWIHVPKNLGLTPADFNGMPIIYDMPDIVEPEEPDDDNTKPEDPGDNNQNPGDPGSSLGGGEIAGIVIGALIVVALIGFASYWFIFRKKSDGDEKAASSSSSSENEV